MYVDVTDATFQTEVVERSAHVPVVTGTWAGDLRYAGTPAPLSTAKFFGARK